MDDKNKAIQFILDKLYNDNDYWDFLKLQYDLRVVLTSIDGKIRLCYNPDNLLFTRVYLTDPFEHSFGIKESFSIIRRMKQINNEKVLELQNNKAAKFLKTIS